MVRLYLQVVSTSHICIVDSGAHLGPFTWSMGCVWTAGFISNPPQFQFVVREGWTREPSWCPFITRTDVNLFNNVKVQTTQNGWSTTWPSLLGRYLTPQPSTWSLLTTPCCSTFCCPGYSAALCRSAALLCCCHSALNPTSSFCGSVPSILAEGFDIHSL